MKDERGNPWCDCFDCKGAGFVRIEWQGTIFEEECGRCRGGGRIENAPVN